MTTPIQAQQVEPVPIPAIDVAAEIAAGEALLKQLAGVAEFALIGSAYYLPAYASDVDYAVMLVDGLDALNFASEMQGGGIP